MRSGVKSRVRGFDNLAASALTPSGTSASRPSDRADWFAVNELIIAATQLGAVSTGTVSPALFFFNP